MTIINFSTERKEQKNDLSEPNNLSKEQVASQMLLDAKAEGLRQISEFNNVIKSLRDVCEKSCIFDGLTNEIHFWEEFSVLMEKVVRGEKPPGSDTEMYQKYRKQIFTKLTKKKGDI